MTQISRLLEEIKKVFPGASVDVSGASVGFQRNAWGHSISYLLSFSSLGGKIHMTSSSVSVCSNRETIAYDNFLKEPASTKRVFKVLFFLEETAFNYHLQNTFVPLDEIQRSLPGGFSSVAVSFVVFASYQEKKVSLNQIKVKASSHYADFLALVVLPQRDSFFFILSASLHLSPLVNALCNNDKIEEWLYQDRSLERKFLYRAKNPWSPKPFVYMESRKPTDCQQPTTEKALEALCEHISSFFSLFTLELSNVVAT